MFLRDAINLAVMGYYLIACVCGVWLSVSLHRDYVPAWRSCHDQRHYLRPGADGALLSLRILVPRADEHHLAHSQRGGGRRGPRREERDHDRSAAAQAETLSAMEELTDITSNSISGKDKIIASGAVDALKDFSLAISKTSHARAKPGSGSAPASAKSGLRGDGPGVASGPRASSHLGRVESDAPYLGIYNEALATCATSTI